MRITWGYWNDFCDRLAIGEINREIAAFGGETADKPQPDRVLGTKEDNGCCRSRGLSREVHSRASADDDGRHRSARQFSRQPR